jgi:hypothetical protein
VPEGFLQGQQGAPLVAQEAALAVEPLLVQAARVEE